MSDSLTDSGSLTDQASALTDKAADVGSTAKESGAQVAQTAADQAKNVVGEAASQTKDLLGQARGELQDQAVAQHQKAVSGLRGLVDELDSMAGHGGSAGPATDLAKRGSAYAGTAANWLDDHEPGELLGELRSLAQRRPGAFLAGALVAGVLAGRLTRGVVAATKEESSPAAAEPTGYDQFADTGLGAEPDFETAPGFETARHGFAGVDADLLDTPSPVGDYTYGDVEPPVIATPGPVDEYGAPTRSYGL